MNELFGISMTAIMAVLLVLFGVCAATFVGVYLANRTMFRMGLRNIGRRRAQTSLVVAGLMLATVIITASFSTGDSLDYSVTNLTYDMLQRTDLRLKFGGGESSGTTAGAPQTGAQVYADESMVPVLEARFADDPDVEGFIPLLFEPVPIINPRTRLSEPRVNLSGVDAGRLGPLGGLRLVDGGRANLDALGEMQGLISQRAADKIDARAGDRVTIYAGGVPWEIEIAGVVKDEIASGVTGATPTEPGGMAMRLATVQRITGREGKVSWVGVALKGNERSSLPRSPAAAKRMTAFLESDEGKTALALGDLSVTVDEIKQFNVDLAELFGNIFTTVFLVLGLFSIAAGVMLIFMLFVMLAAERRTEMGITRAVGAGRMHLVETFMAEGMVYDVLAGVVGALVGVAAGYILIVSATALLGGDFPGLTFHVTLRSLVVSYCLGVVLTFVTVTFSSARISRLNIVAAIRGESDRGGQRARRARMRWPWIVAGVPTTVVLPPLGLYWLLRKGLGLPWSQITGPGGLVAGVLLYLLGWWSGLAFPFTLGISLVIISLGVMAAAHGWRGRPVWSVAGAALAVYWLTPGSWHDALFRTGELSGSMEMFVLSGIMIVAGFTVIIVYNARLLTTLFATRGVSGATRYAVPLVLGAASTVSVAGGLLWGNVADGLGQLFYLLAAFMAMFMVLSWAAVRFPRFAPALKMGVAYPLSNRFRTGMTIAMFSIVVFSITVMGIINNSFLQLFAGDEARAGWDIMATTNPNNPVDDIRAALKEEGSFDANVVTAAGRTTPLRESQEVRQAGRTKWETFVVRAGDDAFYGQAQMKLEARAAGYASDRDVIEAVRSGAHLALIDSQPMQAGGFGGGQFGFRVKGVPVKDHVFDPFEIEYRDPVTGKSGTVKVVGVLAAKIPSNLMFGVYVDELSYRAVYGAPDYQEVFLRLAPGTDAKKAAKGIKAALVTKGVQAESIQKQIDDTMAQSKGFMRLLQAFMGLGLFVGIASLGVIALRSVVERRQQIGMLRAIGYQRGTVALSFLLESGFIALMGILSGVIGAAILAWNLLTSSYFGTTEGITFSIPWIDVIVSTGLAFVFALLMTWWPSQRAASVPIAEALRYE